MKTTDEQIKVLEAKAAEMQREIEVLKTMQQSEQGMTWERAFEIVKPLYYVDGYGGKVGQDAIGMCHSHLNVPTEADAKSLIAHAKLSVIAAACNQGKGKGKVRYSVFCFKDQISDMEYEYSTGVIEFYDKADADQSLITNRQLWLDFYKK